MEDLYNVIIFFDEMSNYSILRHFRKAKRRHSFPEIVNRLNNKFDREIRLSPHKVSSPYKIKTPSRKKPFIGAPYNKEVFNYNLFL
jgi:hypothetical protein